jgi:hypothetical protein
MSTYAAKEKVLSRYASSGLESDFRDALRGTHVEGIHIEGAHVEPLLPIERKLIGFSLGIGLFLLAVLAIVNHLFPVAS